MRSTTGEAVGVLPIAVASVLWGTTGTAAHLLPGEVNPLATGAATMTIGGLLLVVSSARASWRVLRDRRALRWTLIGALGVFAYPLAFYSSMRLAGVAVGTVVSLGSAPVFAAAIEFAVDRRTTGRRWGVSAAAAISGVAILAGGGEGSRASSASVGGVLLGLVAGLAYALYTFAGTRVIASTGSSRGAMGAMFGAGAVLLSPVLIATGAPLAQSTESIGITLYLAVGPMFIAYLLFGSGLRTVPSSTATIITLIEPAVATVLAVAVVGERFGVGGWLGIGLVVVGILIIVVRPSPGSPLGDAPRL